MTSDRHAADAARRGDEDAFLLLVDRHHSLVVRVAGAEHHARAVWLAFLTAPPAPAGLAVRAELAALAAAHAASPPLRHAV